MTFDGRWYKLDDAIVLPVPSHRTPIMVAAGRPRMMRATARFADQWQTAWFGRPDANYRTELDAFRSACDAEGRDPDTVELTVGINVGGDDPDDPRVALDSSAIADALGEWAELGVGHVQAGVYPTIPASFETALEGIRRFRG